MQVDLSSRLKLSVAQPDEDVLRADRTVSIDLDVGVRRRADHLRAGDQRGGGFDRSIEVSRLSTTIAHRQPGAAEGWLRKNHRSGGALGRSLRTPGR